MVSLALIATGSVLLISGVLALLPGVSNEIGTIAGLVSAVQLSVGLMFAMAGIELALGVSSKPVERMKDLAHKVRKRASNDNSAPERRRRRKTSAGNP